MDFLLWIEKTF